MKNNNAPSRKTERESSHALAIFLIPSFSFIYGAGVTGLIAAGGIAGFIGVLFIAFPIALLVVALIVATSRSTVRQAAPVRKGYPKPYWAIPRRAQYLLLLVPHKNREFILGDLEEEFRTILLPQYGLRKAQAYYWWHTFGSLAPFILRFFKRALGLAVILRLIGK